MFQIGQKVRVYISDSEQTASETMKGFSGKVSTVKDVIPYKGSFRTYTLEDMKSKYDTYFEFPEDWLFPADESEAEV